MELVDRRSFLKQLGYAGALSGMAVPAFGEHVIHEIAEPGQDAAVAPKHSIRFSVVRDEP